MSIKLSQKDFDQGTLRLTQPGTYVLTENIVFAPNKGYNYFPRSQQKDYSAPAYGLGFFAAITIEVDHVTLDLQGHHIACSQVFSIQQRFFAIIELASAPFIPGQGPADFGQKVTYANHCVIKNGSLGRSSHHGIHGNNNTDITIMRLTITDYEVAGIALNGFTGVTIENVRIGAPSQQCFVNGRYSAARFLSIAGRQWLQKHGKKCSDARKNKFLKHLSRVEQEMSQVLSSVSQGGPPCPHNYFVNHEVNGTYPPDGNTYALLFHSKGVAIHDFEQLSSLSESEFSRELTIRSVSIHDVKIRATETVTLTDHQGVPLTDFSGSVFPILECVDKFSTTGKISSRATYQHTDLSKAQIYGHLMGLEAGVPFGRSNFSQYFLNWVFQERSFSYLSLKNHQVICNGDDMFHVQKGLCGIRVDGVKKVVMDDVVFDTLINMAPLGDTSGGSYQLSHPKSNQKGYCACDLVAVNLSACVGVSLNDVRIRKLHSYNGDCCGVRIMNGSSGVSFTKCNINGMKVGYIEKNGIWYGQDAYGNQIPYQTNYPNQFPVIYGVRYLQVDDHEGLPSNENLQMKNLDGINDLVHKISLS